MPPNPAIPVTLAALTSAEADFSSAIANAKMGGPPDTALKNDKRDVLVSLLRRLASYVQDNHANDLAKLLASGFDAVSTNRAQTPLATPTITDIINGNSGQIIVVITPIANARVYRLRYCLIGAGGMPGPAVDAGLFNNSRMAVNNLTAGSTYQFQTQAVGGSTGQSDWSDPVSHMSI